LEFDCAARPLRRDRISLAHFNRIEYGRHVIGALGETKVKRECGANVSSTPRLPPQL